ncbi:MAG: putative lipoprotein [Parachlamydiales bacterium]|nr:putative lipoprotein [Parachlamydiales bacterium]
MQRLFQKVFGIYPGEGIKSLRFARLAIFWALGITTLETLSDGFFLEKAGAQFLPIVFLITSLSMVCVSTIVLYCLRFTSPYRILTIAISIGALLCASSAFFVSGSPPLIFWYAFKIASRMLFTVLIACSWTFIDQYHDLQDAKRVYSLYSAAYFLGNICSGILINIALNMLGIPALLIIAAVSLLIALTEARTIAHKTPAVHDDTVDGVFSTDRSGFASIVKLISRSPFTIYLLSLSLITQLLITVSEYSYMDSFGRIFNSAESGISVGTIAEFLGKCRAYISACNILVGFFFYSRFVRRIGLCNAILITPIFFLAVYSQWVTYDTLIIAILGLIAVDGILFTIEDNCFNLLSNAVPAQLKSKVRIINDSFFEPIGMLVSSLLLLGMQSGSRWLGLALTLISLAITLLIRALYSKAILINLKDNALHFDRKLKDWLASMGRREQKEARKDILAALRSGREEVRLLACESLLSLHDATVLAQILEVSRGFGTLSKIQLLKMFEASSFSNDARVLDSIASWMNESESPEFCKWASFYLAKRGLHHPEKVEDDLENSDLLLQGSAILTLQKSLVSQPIETAAIHRAIATKKIEIMLKSSRIDEISMALDILAEGEVPQGAGKALPFLSHDAILVKRSAARCIARLADPHFSRDAPRLIDELESSRDNFFRLYCLDALGKIADSSTVKDLLAASVYFRPNERRRTEEIIIAMGLKTVPILLSLTKDLSIPDRSRILAGKILGRLALPQLQANLTDVIGIEIDRAYFYFYFGHKIQKQYPLYDLELLENALLTGFRSVIDFVIHLLGAAGSLQEPEMLARALYSRNAKIQSNAVESLERTCDPRLFRRISPLIDDRPLEDKLAACLRFKKDLPQLSLSDLLATLDRSGSLYDKVVAARLKAMLQMPNWRQELREQIKRSDETFHHFAYELLET